MNLAKNHVSEFRSSWTLQMTLAQANRITLFSNHENIKVTKKNIDSKFLYFSNKTWTIFKLTFFSEEGKYLSLVACTFFGWVKHTQRLRGPLPMENRSLISWNNDGKTPKNFYYSLLFYYSPICCHKIILMTVYQSIPFIGTSKWPSQWIFTRNAMA